MGCFVSFLVELVFVQMILFVEVIKQKLQNGAYLCFVLTKEKTSVLFIPFKIGHPDDFFKPHFKSEQM